MDGGIGLVGVAGSSDRCLNLNSGKEKRDRRRAMSTFASISPKVIVRVIVEQRCIRHNVEYLL